MVLVRSRRDLSGSQLHSSADRFVDLRFIKSSGLSGNKEIGAGQLDPIYVRFDALFICGVFQLTKNFAAMQGKTLDLF